MISNTDKHPSSQCAVPLLMMMLSVAVYYLSDKCPYVEYMNDKTEAQFLQGIKYAAIDTILECTVFIVYASFLKIKVGVDLIRVGRHIMAQHAEYFFSLPSPRACTFSSCSSLMSAQIRASNSISCARTLMRQKRSQHWKELLTTSVIDREGSVPYDRVF